MLKLISVPLLYLLVLPCREEQMSLGDELQEHDAEGRKRINVKKTTSTKGEFQSTDTHEEAESERAAAAAR